MPRHVVIPKNGGVEVLEVRDAPARNLDEGEIRIRVAASGVNFADLMMRMGLYPEAPPKPFVPGYEVCGTVAEVAAGLDFETRSFRVGDRVMAPTRFGGYAEDVTIPARLVHPLPDGWSFVDGAAFPVVFLTAWSALRPLARIQEGDRVLVHGIAGGVGLAALQIARRYRGRVIGTCGGASKQRAAEALGAERAIDHSSEDVATVVREWAPGGLDVILEPRGLRALRADLDLLAPGGRVVSYGASDLVSGTTRDVLRMLPEIGAALRWNPFDLVKRNVGVLGLNVLRLWDHHDLLHRANRELGEGIEAGDYRPVVDRTFLLEAAGEAHRYLHERRNVGKVVLTTGLE